MRDGVDLDLLAKRLVTSFRKDTLNGQGCDAICLTGADDSVLRGLQKRMQAAAVEGGLNGVEVIVGFDETAIRGANRSYVVYADYFIKYPHLA